jgi:cytochrome P450
MLALLRHPYQWELLADAPERVANAVEELLRFDAPLQRTFRIATENVSFADTVVRRGQIVSMMLGAANRDPEIWRDPDDLDVTRAPGRHLSFGQGIHYCVGAPLARLEVTLAITALLRSFPSMSVAPETLAYQPTFGLRALRALPVVLR